MHIYFSGIGGAGIGPLAMVAHQAGYRVSGSDKQHSAYIDYLREHGVTNVHIGQSRLDISSLHADDPIDWFVYSSALPLEDPNAPELQFCTEQNIKSTKRDEFLSQFLATNNQQLIAVAGTHGKTTTTAMVVWLCKQTGIGINYILPAKTAYATMGHFNPSNKYFVYEADEFDRNFLAYNPAISLVTGVSYDHHEIFNTRHEYKQAFCDFIAKSGQTFIWDEDAAYLTTTESPTVQILSRSDKLLSTIKLAGEANRRDGLLAVIGVQQIDNDKSGDEAVLIDIINKFPGLSRRMEPIAANIYSDYAHTPEKIRAAMSVGREMSAATNQPLVVVYEPLTNRRQLHMLHDYDDCFSGAQHVYWLPSYLAREDPNDRIIAPAELIQNLADPSIASPAERDEELKSSIQKHVADGAMVVCMAGGGGNSLDDWLRISFA